MARPLTKKKEDGKLYVRPLEIETAIDAARLQDIATLQRRASCSRRDSPGFMPLECLVYIIREARQRRDEATMNLLLPPLLARCEAMLMSKIPDSRPNGAKIRGEILGEFSVLFAEDGSGENPDELDFFECRFNRAFRSFWISFMRRPSTRAMLLEVSLNENKGEDSPGDEDSIAGKFSEFQQPAMQFSGVFRDELLNAINSLPPDERRAVVLCHMLGYKAESEIPSETTAATLCRVTGRTIRNRLERAAKKLSKFSDKEVER
jgi:DNA-directed RNA polymerase specialized sigma24 family protein